MKQYFENQNFETRILKIRILTFKNNDNVSLAYFMLRIRSFDLETVKLGQHKKLSMQLIFSSNNLHFWLAASICYN